MTVQTPPRPRWGHRTSLWQWREPAFWFFASIVLLTTLFSLVVQAGFASVSPTGWVISWLLMLVYAIPMFLLVYLLDLYEREPLSLIFGAILWGAFAATILSIIASLGWQDLVFGWLGDAALEWGAAAIAPPIEEILKGCGIVFLALIARNEIDDVMDGFVYGAMVGLGFTVVEDVLYFLGVFGGTVGGVLEGFFIRVIASGLYGHVLYTGLFGIAVAYFIARRGEVGVGRRLAVAGGLIGLAILGHAIWNSPLLFFFPETLATPADYAQLVAATTVKGAPLLVFVLLMIRLARRREHRWLRSALTGEVGGVGIQPAEIAVLESPGRRRRARRELRARAGAAAAETLKRLHRAQIDLAMIATRVGDPEHTDLIRQREYCAALRESLARYTPAPPAPA